MSTFDIDFSDPLKPGFQIAPGDMNGPGGSSTATTLRLYGRGALEWGEAVDENFIRLIENFASASPPSFAISGQLWMEQKLYYRDTNAGSALQGWYFYDESVPTPDKWRLVNGTGVVSSSAPITPTVGQYYFNGTSGELYGYYRLGKYETVNWVPRSHFTGAGVPVSPVTTPRISLKIYDGAAGAWTAPTTTAVTTGPAPSSPQAGMLWYNSSTGNLLVYTGTVWQELLGPSSGNAATASGAVDMANFSISNLGAPVNAQDAANKAYVDGVVGGISVFVPLAGGTMTGNLVINSALDVSGPVNFAGTASIFNVNGTSGTFQNLTVNTTTQLNGLANVTGPLAVGGVATFSNTVSLSNNRIQLLATPLLSTDGANKGYVDSAITAATSGALNATQVSLANQGGIPKDGDVRTFAPNIVEIYSNGSWRRIFPAQWA